MYENLHLLEVLVAAQFCGAFNGSQIGRGFGAAGPVFWTRVIEGDSSVSQKHLHSSATLPLTPTSNKDRLL